jgi:transcriptional regulator NrdR family protein
MSMKCPVCHADDHGVLRTVARDDEIRRTRRCDRCGHSWATREIAAAALEAASAVLDKARELANLVGVD